MEDLSDRELERFLEENLAGELFCGFEMGEVTPDHSSFEVMRTRLGTVAEIAATPEARFGNKGRTKWYGYKIHASVDMSLGVVPGNGEVSVPGVHAGDLP